ncbi:MAG: hypothetical protein JSR11_03630 [Bacteroidetes bacterium]|nr:hypothetical protein [Bacteroidota bacterium]
MGEVVFNKQNNRRKRTLPGYDHYTGLIFYSNVLPEGFGNNDRIKLIADITTAENLGITSGNANLLVKIMHYHISQLFRFNPDAILYVGIFSEPAVDAEHTFEELNAIRIYAQNKIRQVGVFSKKAYVTAHIGLLQDCYNSAYLTKSQFEILYTPNMVGVANDALPDYSQGTNPNVHVLIAQDGAALGKALFTAAQTYSVGCIGAALGILSLSKVSENIGWVEKYNLSEDGGELDVPALSNGTLVSELAESYIKHDGILDTKRLIFIKKYPNITGSYFNDSHGCVKASDDYAYIEDNRTIDKAIRGIYANMMPHINGPSLFDKVTKKLRTETISFIQLEASKALEQMEKDDELSGYTVTIDPDQDSYNTGSIEIDISNTAVGVNRKFIINIGY